MHARARRRVGALLLMLAGVCAYSGLDMPRGAFLEDVLGAGGADQAKCKPTGMIKDACCHFEEVESLNDRLSHLLNDVVREPFFRFHRVDLYRDCPFWTDEGACGNRACAVDWLEEDHIPERWRSEALGGLKTPSAGEVPSLLEGGCDAPETDFCVLEDETTQDSIYVDLIENPERFTGYTGHSAHKVWKAIYEENCFGVVPYLPPSRGRDEGGTGFVTGLSSATDLRSLMGSLAGPRDAGEDMCLEKRVFYRLMSGLHASISIHICDEYLDQQTGEWAPNLQCFITRIAQHPERLQNVYFDYVLLLRAFEKAQPYFEAYDVATGDDAVDRRTRQAIVRLAHEAQTCPSTFDESTMFLGAGADVLKDEFRQHFRNISRIMDCVGCDRCRLWGKLQVTGLGTALKLLFSYEDGGAADLALQRSEMVAFVNTLHRFSESLAAIDRFRRLWAERDAAPSSSSSPVAPPQASVETVPRGSASPALDARGAEHHAYAGAVPRRRAAFMAPGQQAAALPAQPKARSVFVSDPAGEPATVGDFVDALLCACRAGWSGCASFLSRCLRSLLRHVSDRPSTLHSEL